MKYLVLLLTEKDLKKVLDMKEVIDLMEKAFSAFVKGETEVPLRPIINIKKYRGTMLYMPAYVEPLNSLAVKIVSVYPDNIVKHKLPTIYATIQLNNPETGEPLAFMDGSYITALRTGAATGLATKYLSRKDSKVLGVIGAGKQAFTQVWAVKEVREIETVLVYDVVKDKAEELAEKINERFRIEGRSVETAEKAVEPSDVLIVATTSVKPVLKGEWIKPGTHVNSIGWMGKDARELDTETVKKSKVFVDSKEAVLAESGDIIIPIKEGAINEGHVYAELGEVVTGLKKGRVSRDEVTLWKSVGLAVQDAVTAKHAYTKSLQEGVGKHFPL